MCGGAGREPRKPSKRKKKLLLFPFFQSPNLAARRAKMPFCFSFCSGVKLGSVLLLASAVVALFEAPAAAAVVAVKCEVSGAAWCAEV